MGKVFRIIGVVAVLGILIAAIVTSMTHKTPNSEIVWDKDMTVGNMDAKNYFIIYSDIACPYCLAFENAIVEHEEEFKEYIEKNDILVEVRLSDFMYEYGQSQSIQSRYSAEAIYCAKNEGKFWDYYNNLIVKVWNGWFKESGKAAYNEFNKIEKEYYIKAGKEVGLGETFEACVENEEPLADIVKNAQKMAKLVDGMPHFKFNNYTPSGFDLNWGWEYVKLFFDAGLKS
ncbi:thioredoxin domain-containing protein [Candidatus Saccharibacteria bacterium]|nr:thioredoxin domain-containing protein [Candidatus Saccharibacteria bacterium]